MLNETFSVIFKHCDFGWFSNNVSKVFWRENSNIGVRQNRGTSAYFMNKIFSLEPDFFLWDNFLRATIKNWENVRDAALVHERWAFGFVNKAIFTWLLVPCLTGKLLLWFLIASN